MTLSLHVDHVLRTEPTEPCGSRFDPHDYDSFMLYDE